MGKMLTVRETAERLNVREKTIYAMISRGEIPGYKLGRCVRVDEQDLAEYKRAHRIQPPPQEKIDVRTQRKLIRQREAAQDAGYTGLSCLKRYQA